MKKYQTVGMPSSSIKLLGLAMAAGGMLAMGCASAATVSWAGGSGDWDTSTQNWLDGAMSPVAFTNGDAAVFDNTNAGAINVVGTVEPLSTTVSAVSGDYTISGGVIGGTGPLTKTSGGTLILKGANTFTGKANIQAGMLQLGQNSTQGITPAGVPGPLGAPTGANATIGLHSGVILYLPSTSPRVDQATDRPIDLAGTGPGTVTIRVNDNDTAFSFGAVTATGTGAKTLALRMGYNGNGDRESMIFNNGIADSSDASPTSLEVDYGPGGVANRYLSLVGDSTFTGPISLVAHNGPGYLTVGGLRTGNTNAPPSNQNVPGTGRLAGGSYPGDIALGAKTIFNYLSSASQTLSGAVSGAGTVIVDGGGTMTLSGPSTYSGNTTVNSGSTLVLADGGGMTFYITNTSSNKITGAGAANLNGDFTIDTSAVTVAVGSWTLVDAATKPFGATFTVAGPGWSEASDVWTKVDGSRTWTFTEADGVLRLTALAVFTSFDFAGTAGVIDNNLRTIKLVVPKGTDFATIAPTFTLSSGTCDQTSGAVPTPSFGVANPVTYTVTDGGTMRPYAVTVVEATGIINVSAEKAGELSDLALLTGPGGGLGETWNQVTVNTGSALLDSVGAATGVGFTINTDGLDYWNNGALQMLHSGFRTFGKGLTEQLVISGLTTGDVYDVWIASTQGNAEAGKGVWSTPNPTSTVGAQSVDSSVALNITTWEQGNNYVSFENVVVDVNGKIVFDGAAAPNYRLPVNGFQLVPASAARITSFGIPGSDGVIDHTAKTIALQVPFGTNLATLAPSFTVNSGTCDQTSGAVPSPSFAGGPVTYTVTDTATDPDTVNAYVVTVTVLPQTGTHVINLGTSPAGTFIVGGTSDTAVTLPALPVGSILRSISIDSIIESTTNNNFASELAILFDPTPGTPGGDFSVAIVNGDHFGAAVELTWPEAADIGPINPLVDTKTDADWSAAGDIDLGTTGLFLGNGYAAEFPGAGGTWSGTITLTYDLVGGGSNFSDWISDPAFGLAPGDQGFTNDPDGDSLDNGIEAFFGTNPGLFTAGLSQVSTTGAVTTFRHPEADPPLGDVTGSYEWSLDLVNWNASGAEVSGTTVTIPPPPAPVAGITTVTATATGTIPAKLFLRVVATN